MICMFVSIAITYSKSMDQLGKVAKPSHGQLNSENEVSLDASVLFPFVCI